MTHKQLSVLLATIAVLCMLGMSHMPMGYYTFLRLAVVGTLGYLLVVRRQSLHPLVIAALIGLVLLYNPVFPVELRRSQWQPINFVSGLAFAAMAVVSYSASKRTVRHTNLATSTEMQEPLPAKSSPAGANVPADTSTKVEDEAVRLAYERIKSRLKG